PDALQGGKISKPQTSVKVYRKYIGPTKHQLVAWNIGTFLQYLLKVCGFKGLDNDPVPGIVVINAFQYPLDQLLINPFFGPFEFNQYFGPSIDQFENLVKGRDSFMPLGPGKRMGHVQGLNLIIV